MLPLFAASVGSAGDRRGPLHLGLGPRLPARLPARPGHAGAAAGPGGRARHHRHRQRPRRRRRDRAARRRRIGAPLRTYRGPLARTSLRMEVVDLPRPAQRLAWLAEHLPELAGSGIVYTLTKRDADQVAQFLNAQGISALAYSGDQETSDRVAAEDRLLANDVKAIVATSALGMGYDKSDLTFVVHYQAPGSVVVLLPAGRSRRPRGAARRRRAAAGRGGPPDPGLLHRAVVPVPGAGHGRAGGSARRPATTGRSTQELLTVVNIGRGRLEAMLKILDVEGALRRDGSRWLAMADSGWEYDAERYARITALRRDEQRAMERFGADGRCLMRVLQEELDDPQPQDCGRCSVCTAPRFAAEPDPALVELAGRHLRSRPIELEVKKMAPGDDRRDAQDPRECPHRAGLGAGPVRRRRLVAGGRAGPAGGRVRGRRGGGARRRGAGGGSTGRLGHLGAVGAPSGPAEPAGGPAGGRAGAFRR